MEKKFTTAFTTVLKYIPWWETKLSLTTEWWPWQKKKKRKKEVDKDQTCSCESLCGSGMGPGPGGRAVGDLGGDWPGGEFGEWGDELRFACGCGLWWWWLGVLEPGLLGTYCPDQIRRRPDRGSGSRQGIKTGGETSRHVSCRVNKQAYRG